MSFGIKSGKGWKLPFIVVFNIYFIDIVTNMPGVAMAPIQNQLQHIFPHVSELGIQMVYLIPNIIGIPFVFTGGALATRFNKIKLLNWCLIPFALSNIPLYFSDSFTWIIVVSLVGGIATAVMAPISIALISDCFAGKERSKQFGLTTAAVNAFFFLCMIGTGNLAEISWRLPFILYFLPIIPVFLMKPLSKYLTEPVPHHDDPKAVNAKKEAEKKPVAKLHFSKECRVPSLIKFCCYSLALSFFGGTINLYLPFMVSNSGIAGDILSVAYISGFVGGLIINWVIKEFKHWLLPVTMYCEVLAFVIILIFHKDPIIIGCAIFIASFFGGVVSPYLYNRVSNFTTPRAIPMAQSLLICATASGGVITPFVYEAIAHFAHRSLHADPVFPFMMSTVGLGVCATIVLIYMLIKAAARKVKEHEHREAVKAGKATTPETAKPDQNPDAHSLTPVEDDAHAVRLTNDNLYKKHLQALAIAADKAAERAEAAAKAAAQAAAQAAQAAGAPATPSTTLS